MEAGGHIIKNETIFQYIPTRKKDCELYTPHTLDHIIKTINSDISHIFFPI